MHETTIEINGRMIGEGQEPFIIAELSGNHNGHPQTAKAIIDAAAEAGADAVKLQTYTADTLTIDCDRRDFLISEAGTPWDGRRLYELYQQAHTPWDWHEALFTHARARGILCFSSPFDTTAVDFLESLGCPAYKIASFENNDLELIAKAAATGKPLLISTGLSGPETLSDAVATARAAGCRQLMLMKCTSSYPAQPADSHVATIAHMQRLFRCPVGFSDHTPGLGAALAAVACGAAAVEKHLTLRRSDGGVDAAFSLEPAELALLKEESRRARQAVGRVSYEIQPSEQPSIIFKRSLYIVRDMAAGELLSRENLRAIRPGHGLAPKALPWVIGRRINTPVPRGTPLSWALLD